jgi:hypothetical protein
MFQRYPSIAIEELSVEQTFVEVLTTMVVFLAVIVVLAGVVALIRGGPVHSIVLIACGHLIGSWVLA